jgi:hypothetical protein
VLVRRRLVAAWPLVAVSALHLVFTIATSDPADGVRYQLPAQMAVALAAALGLDAVAQLARVRLLVSLVAVALLLGYWIYARPVVCPRATEASPPVRAISWANATLPKEAVVLVDLPLRPHAEATLEGFRTLPVEPGLAATYDSPDNELWVLADGFSRVPGAQIFSWPASDAYGKLTRNHYRVVSMIPLGPERRYLPVNGVNPWERDADRSEWRWLDQVASLRLPPGEGSLRMEFHLPREVPYGASRVTVKVDGSVATAIDLARGATSTVEVDVPEGRYVDVEVVSSEAFTPAAGAGRDPRRLAITLTDLTRARRLGGN